MIGYNKLKGDPKSGSLRPGGTFPHGQGRQLSEACVVTAGQLASHPGTCSLPPEEVAPGAVLVTPAMIPAWPHDL